MSHAPRDSEPVRRVLDRLDALGKTYKYVNGQWMAQCVAHEDRNPSLAVKEGDGGAILTCHAGCDTDDVVAALGLRMSDLFAKNPSAASERRGSEPPSRMASASITPLRDQDLLWVKDYVYEDASGSPVMKVSRYARVDATGATVGKSFRQYRRERGGWVAGLNGSAPPLYRLPAIMAAVEAGAPVVVVEGEKDADRAVAEDVCATTSPMGAGKWRAEHSAVLQGASVLVVADDDPPGHAHARAVYASLMGVAATVQLALPAPGCKDLSEHLDAGNELFALRLVSPEDLTPGEVPTEEPAEPPRLGATPASAVVLKRVRWGWQDRMPIGELTLIPGREGVGKSLLLAWLAAQLTNGTLPGEFHGQPWAVLYVASEDSWAYTVAPRMKAAGADLDRVYRVDPLDGGRIYLPADCNEVADLAVEVKAAAIMLDPIVSLIDDRLNVNQSRELRQALEPLRRAAERADLMVPALAHFNKTTDTDVLSKIPGARAWAEVARAAFGVAADEEGNCYVASQIKNNLGRVDLPSLTYTIEGVQVDTTDGPTNVGRLVWGAESDTDVSEVLSRKPVTKAREVSEATNDIVDWVVGNGWLVSVAEVHEHFADMKRDTVKKVLLRAAQRGTLSNPTYGHYGPPRRAGT